MLNKKIAIYGQDELYVTLKDVMGSDADIVNAARVSYNNDEKDNYSAGLIDYLMRHKHTSPFEMVEYKFELQMPIYIARQWFRHRTAHWSSFNEVSARYTEVEDKFYTPFEFSVNNKDNKQAGNVIVNNEKTANWGNTVMTNNSICFLNYNNLLASGVSREDARMVLPLNTLTRFIWKIDLSNLLHFILLRNDPTAQHLIREYANVLASIVEQINPDTYKAFKKYVVDVVTLTAEEVYWLFDGVNISSAYENMKKDLSPSKLAELERKLNFIRKNKRIGGNR